MSETPLLCEIQDGVATLTFNRPAQLNAFNSELCRMFDERMIAIEQDPNVRAVVLTGVGRGFCVGTDMADLRKTSDKGGEDFPRPDQPPAMFDVFTDAPPELRSRYVLPKAMSKPVIAAVNGACAGIGLALAASSDVRFASRSAVFTAIFARRGLIAETGVAHLLTHLIGAGAAADMLLSARRIAGEEAREIGLANRLCEPDDLLPQALAYARDIAANVSPRSVRVIKRQLWAAQQQTFMDAAILAYREAGRSFRSEDFKEGIAHFVEKRPARFTGR